MPDGPLALEVRSVSKAFGRIVALDNVCFTLQRGEIRALIGHNGAGKSTRRPSAWMSRSAPTTSSTPPRFPITSTRSGGKSTCMKVQAVRRSQMTPVAVVADTAVIDR
jgi:ABC-type phosphonate transport system ATPase subunit